MRSRAGLPSALHPYAEKATCTPRTGLYDPTAHGSTGLSTLLSSCLLALSTATSAVGGLGAGTIREEESTGKAEFDMKRLLGSRMARRLGRQWDAAC